MLQELFEKVPILAKANTPTFLTSVGVTGVISTAYLAGSGSFKAAALLEKDYTLREKQAHITQEPFEESTVKDKIKLVWHLYLPAVSVGATTITAIVMANHEASKKIAALTVASGISERAFQEYKAKVVQKLGENKETAIRDEIAQDRVRADPPSDMIVIEAGDVLCFDMLTGRYFKSSMEKIRKAENTVNHDIINHMYASLSQFYQEIGLEPTPYSEEVGWSSSNALIDVQYSTVMSPDDRPCIAIDFASPPYPEYSRLW